MTTDNVMSRIQIEAALFEHGEALAQKINPGVKPPTSTIVELLTSSATSLLNLCCHIARVAAMEERRAAAAHLLDRADQDRDDGSQWVPLTDGVGALVRGDHIAARDHGELDDDLYKRAESIGGKELPSIADGPKPQPFVKHEYALGWDLTVCRKCGGEIQEFGLNTPCPGTPKDLLFRDLMIPAAMARGRHQCRDAISSFIRKLREIAIGNDNKDLGDFLALLSQDLPSAFRYPIVEPRIAELEMDKVKTIGKIVMKRLKDGMPSPEVVQVAKESADREVALKDWLYHRSELDGWTGEECLSFAKALLSSGKTETDASP